MMKNHITWHNGHINRQDRNRLNNHKSGLVWFTGLPSSGKSTIAHLMEKELFSRSIRSYVLDGDNVRHGLNSNLGFNRGDRRETLRRIVELSKLMVDAGLIVLAAFISPYREEREYVRSRFNGDNFLEIYIRGSVEECERMDPMGNYKRARAGIIREYTGISAPYEEPVNPDLIIDTEKVALESSIHMVLELLNKKILYSLTDNNRFKRSLIALYFENRFLLISKAYIANPNPKNTKIIWGINIYLENGLNSKFTIFVSGGTITPT